jgi:hypothetical protein
MSHGTFGLYWEPKTGPLVEEARAKPIAEVMSFVARLTRTPAVMMVKRVYVVCEQDDTITFDWNVEDGLTFPTQDLLSAEYYAQMRAAFPGRKDRGA